MRVRSLSSSSGAGANRAHDLAGELVERQPDRSRDSREGAGGHGGELSAVLHEAGAAVRPEPRRRRRTRRRRRGTAKTSSCRAPPHHALTYTTRLRGVIVKGGSRKCPRQCPGSAHRNGVSRVIGMACRGSSVWVVALTLRD